MCLRSGNLRDKIAKKWLDPWLLELAKIVERSHSSQWRCRLRGGFREASFCKLNLRDRRVSWVLITFFVQ